MTKKAQVSLSKVSSRISNAKQFLDELKDYGPLTMEVRNHLSESQQSNWDDRLLRLDLELGLLERHFSTRLLDGAFLASEPELARIFYEYLLPHRKRIEDLLDWSIFGEPDGMDSTVVTPDFARKPGPTRSEVVEQYFGQAIYELESRIDGPSYGDIYDSLGPFADAVPSEVRMIVSGR